MPQKVLSLFSHPKFESRVETDEDEIIPVDQKGLPELLATRAVDHWLSLEGLPRPRTYRLQAVRKEAVGEIASVIRGKHPHVAKLSFEQLITSINNFHLTATDPNYHPADKTHVKKVDLIRFIYNRYTGKSWLMMSLQYPLMVTKELNPKLTRLIKRHFAQEKWGADESEILTSEHVNFVKASNRVAKYLTEHRNKFSPHMQLSPESPERAAYGLIKAVKNSSNWNEFKSQWLSSDISLNALDAWLKSQGFFKPTAPSRLAR